MSDAIGVIGFYFTLVGFISGLFFTRIDSWYGSIRSFQGSLSSIRDAGKFRERQSEMEGLRASEPKGSFIAIGILLSLLTILAWFIPISNPPINAYLYIYTPLSITVAAYWAGGFILLRKGSSLLNQSERTIEEGISG